MLKSKREWIGLSHAGSYDLEGGEIFGYLTTMLVFHVSGLGYPGLRATAVESLPLTSPHLL